ncbi:TetR/AcrR family transcriptional regulator [Chitinophaga tropicalis]|nr:TetR/AcrR family transcriptional regulator [Chitinophaga tropicalis]
MKNKEIQEQRMRGYFLDATKEMVRAEGLKSLSVRSIADKAGYSYATMYSYFKDVNDLVFLCVQDFYEECRQQVTDQTKKKERGLKRLKAMVRAYADFFVQYPGIFELFFLERMGNFKESDVINLSLDRICEEEWNYCAAKGIIRAEEIEGMKARTRYTIFGLLLMYLNRRAPSSYTEFLHLFNAQLDTILENSRPEQSSTTVNNSLISIKVGNNK